MTIDDLMSELSLLFQLIKNLNVQIEFIEIKDEKGNIILVE